MHFTRYRTHYLIAAAVSLFAFLIYYVADAGHDEPRLIVIGDSLSTTHESWPNFLREMAPRWNVQILTQNGRTIRDFSMPRDLWTTGDRNETVIYFLGCNDALQRNEIMYAETRLRTHISFLLDRNFKILLVIPPTLGEGDEELSKSIERHRALVKSYRGTHPNLWVYDADEVWDVSKCPDGVHPNQELSLQLAEAINWVLALNIY